MSRNAPGARLRDYDRASWPARVRLSVPGALSRERAVLVRARRGGRVREGVMGWYLRKSLPRRPAPAEPLQARPRRLGGRDRGAGQGGRDGDALRSMGAGAGSITAGAARGSGGRDSSWPHSSALRSRGWPAPSCAALTYSTRRGAHGLCNRGPRERPGGLLR